MVIIEQREAYKCATCEAVYFTEERAKKCELQGVSQACMSLLGFRGHTYYWKKGDIVWHAGRFQYGKIVGTKQFGHIVYPLVEYFNEGGMNTSNNFNDPKADFGSHKEPAEMMYFLPANDVSTQVASLQKAIGNATAQRDVVRVDYYAPDTDHSPYPCMVHDRESDLSLNEDDIIRTLCDQAGITDGDGFYITVTKTGQRPFRDRKFMLTRPNHYERLKE